jgi:5-carboxymethyl-2-hydroxymuconate isomerase
MARNIEIKARIDAIEALLSRARGLADREFIELEVVLRAGQSDEEGRAIAERLMRELGLAAAPRVAGAHLDLLAAD